MKGMSDKVVGGARAGTAAWAAFGLALALGATAIAGSWLVGLDRTTVVGTYLLTNIVIGLGFAPCGFLLAVHRVRNPIGWLLLGVGTAHLGSAAAVPLLERAVDAGWPLEAVRLAATVFTWSWPLGVGLCLPLALQLFPTGHALAPSWRKLSWMTVAAGVLFAVAAGGARQVEISGLTVAPYPRISLAGLWALANLLGAMVYAATVASLVIRYRRGDETLRRQLLWLVLAVVAVVVVNAQRWLTGTGPILLLLALPLIPASITIAMLRHQLLDIRLVVSRVVLYGGLTAGVVGVYAALLAGFDLVLRGADAHILVTLLVALAFNPVRIRAQRLVDQAFYGARRDPVRAVSQVGERIAEPDAQGSTADDDLGAAVAELREALRLPFAAVRSAGPSGRELVASGSPPETLQRLPLTFRRTHVGDLVVGPRRGERRLAAADRAVLELLTVPLAAALSAITLSDQLQESRERIVVAREEERRRLHRDLHDGLGPILTGAALKADAAYNLLADEPARAAALLQELGAQLRDAIGDVRRLVHGLRPPALDELGLTGALRSQARALSLRMTLDAPDPFPQLPAAVEVAAYRIATEALTNAARHAWAANAVVEIRVDQAVRLTITDDGDGQGGWVPGVGLTSIRERAAELGGRYEAGPTDEGGRVHVMLPLGRPA
jgi:signal transduction histidine kinase